MGEADGPLVVEGQDQPFVVEVELAEDLLLEQVDGDGLTQAWGAGARQNAICGASRSTKAP